MPNKPKKVLIIGSGPIIIGQAAEFDYAGTQACKAMREEGVISVLVNSNPATIMTDEDVADIVYIEPLTLDSVTRIIERERPDGILPTLGGQVGLNLAVELADAGVLEKYNVRCLGTPIQTIRNASERDLFKNLLESIGEPVLESAIANSMEEAREVARTNRSAPHHPPFLYPGRHRRRYCQYLGRDGRDLHPRSGCQLDSSGPAGEIRRRLERTGI